MCILTILIIKLIKKTHTHTDMVRTQNLKLMSNLIWDLPRFETYLWLAIKWTLVCTCTIYLAFSDLYRIISSVFILYSQCIPQEIFFKVGSSLCFFFISHIFPWSSRCSFAWSNSSNKYENMQATNHALMKSLQTISSLSPFPSSSFCPLTQVKKTP